MNKKEINKNGALVTGTVLSCKMVVCVKVQNGKKPRLLLERAGARLYCVRYQFKVNGKKYTGRSLRYYRSIRPIAGDQIPIRYNPQDPSINDVSYITSGSAFSV